MTDSHMFCTGIVSVMIIRCIGIHIPAALLGVGKVFMLADSECIVYGKEGILRYLTDESNEKTATKFGQISTYKLFIKRQLGWI